MATKQQIAAWALRSYPDAGDAAFIVHGGRVTGGMAREFMESLRSYFVARPFVRELGSALREAKGQAATSIADQELAAQIWKEHAESFLKDMYAAHDDGRVLFGQTYDTPGHVEAWVKRKGYVAKKNPRRRNPADLYKAGASVYGEVPVRPEDKLPRGSRMWDIMHRDFDGAYHYHVVADSPEEALRTFFDWQNEGRKAGKTVQFARNPRRRNPAKKATASASLIEGLKELTEYNHHTEALLQLSGATDVAASGKPTLAASDLSDLTHELKAILVARDRKGYMDAALSSRSYAAYKKLMAKAKRVYTAASYKKIHDAL